MFLFNVLFLYVTIYFMSYNCWRINMEVKQQKKVKKLIGEGIKFERIRRITSYLLVQ